MSNTTFNPHARTPAVGGVCVVCRRSGTTGEHLAATRAPSPFATVARLRAAASRVNVDTAEQAAHSGAMLALMLSPQDSALVGEAGPGVVDPSEMHVTLLYLGDAASLSVDTVTALQAVVDDAAALLDGPLTVELTGTGAFTPNDDGDVPVVALPSSSALTEFREQVVGRVRAAYPEATVKDRYLPHITLRYDAAGDAEVPLWDSPRMVTFEGVSLVVAGERYTVKFGETQQAVVAALPESTVDGAVQVTLPVVSGPEGVVVSGLRTSGGPAQVTLADTAFSRSQVNATKSFLTQIGDRMVAAAQVQVLTDGWAPELPDNPSLLWVGGRFVGSTDPNRNGAMWAADSLAVAQPTVDYAPLNWLHDQKHIIGTLAMSRYVVPSDADAVQVPYIEAVAAVWQWIWPDEAAVIQMASDAGRLWYSMECVADAIRCTGPNGCGEVFPFGAAMRGDASVCVHIRERSATREFLNPVFTGGAIVVPPARPGWADADARVLETAPEVPELSVEQALLSERAFEDAGRPDIDPDVWAMIVQAAA